MATMSLPNGLRTLLERAHDLVLVTTTTDGQIVFWNPAAERRLGHRVRDVIGHAIGEILPSEAEPWQLPLASGFDRTFEVRTRTRSGRTIWLDVTAFAADERAIVIYVVRDVTRTRELLRSLHEHLVPNGHDTRLTPREREVLRAIAAGLGTAAMAERMGVSRATIRNHAQNIFGKLGAHTRLEAVMLATRRRLL
jgi:PAS domain S-box-containing protein